MKLRLLWLALVVACGGGDGAGRPDGGLVPIRFRALVPDTTPAGAIVYIAGSFQDWNPGSPQHALTEVAPRTHEITLSFAPSSRVEFKLTRGTWSSVERGPLGEEVPNRTHDVVAPATVEVTVDSWADVALSTVTGDVTKTSVPGFLGGRRIWVYLPPGYRDGTDRYPVLYLLDGQNVFDRATSFAGEWRADETLQHLIPRGEMAPIVVVAVDHGGSARIEEYTPWRDAGEARGGGGGAHLDAIADVLVPHIDATYRTRPGPATTGLGGASLGGLMALYAVHARPDVFGIAAALSPSIWWAGRMIVSAPARPPARVWMDMGTNEYASGISDLRLMRDALVAQGFVLDGDLEVVEAPGAGHNEAAWSARFPDVMRYLFP